MGGCRCSFRTCERRTLTHPDTHYFHYPYKNRERCEKWTQNAGRPEFMELPDTQLRNKVVCSAHFRRNQFMNDLCNSLTKFAVPTIHTLLNGDVLDYERDAENPTREWRAGRPFDEVMSDMDGTEELEPEVHGPIETIEDGFEEIFAEDPMVIHTNDACFSVVMNNEAPLDDSSQLLPPTQHANKQPQREAITATTIAPKILNGTPHASKPVGNMVKLKRIQKRSAAPNTTTSTSSQTAVKIPKLNPTAERSSSAVDDVADPAVKIAELDAKIAAYEAEISQLKSSFAEQTHEYNIQLDINQELQNTIDAQKIHQRTLDDEAARLRRENSRMKAKLVAVETQLESVQQLNETRRIELESERDETTQLRAANDDQTRRLSQQCQEIEQLKRRASAASSETSTPIVRGMKADNVTQPSSSSSSAPTSANAKSKPEKLPPLSKPQLFNGIRRYLNPSMISLLRMEMFADAEREYKPDERQIAMELWQLPPAERAAHGDGGVYEFMRSEWRFRLPPKGDVLQWIRERDENVTAAEDDWDDC